MADMAYTVDSVIHLDLAGENKKISSVYIEMNYQEKYLKYKAKYKALKMIQTGGNEQEWLNYSGLTMKNLKNKDNIRIILGAGNLGDDKNKFKNNQYDLAVTKDPTLINKNDNDPVAIKADFNDLTFFLLRLSVMLKEKISKIIFDTSTTKFVTWRNGGVELLFNAMKPGGKIFVDQTVYERIVVKPSELTTDHTTLKENEFYGVFFADIQGDEELAKIFAGIKFPTDNDVREHNANLFKKAGFNAEIVDSEKSNKPYPLSTLVKNNVKYYLEITKPEKN